MRIKGDKTRWKSFVGARKGVRSKQKIRELTDKIDNVQTRISAHMQEPLLNNVSGLGLAIKKLQDAHGDLGIATENELSSLRGGITALKGVLQQRQSDELDPALITRISEQMRRLAEDMDNFRVNGVEASSTQKLLKKLYFTSISTREHKVEKAHARTFQWLVSSPGPSPPPGREPASRLDFITWLSKGDGIFWIHGKAGSEKSTFIKFVCSQNAVRDHLEHWAQGYQLIAPSFYFWYAGSRLQRSLEGLLRTLLFEILRHLPGVVSSIVNDSKIAVPLSDADWDLEALFAMYEFMIRQQAIVKFCFFH
ncbi:uncharacterized protein PG986_010366 [Apiospora aurea]|uniref:Nephrocystin 3-like N-terminal domain-containing protein n=1 Tax=Apiospora aurea TaxID=335848 RepID=A0ABR1Q236_9PEZI